MDWIPAAVVYDILFTDRWDCNGEGIRPMNFHYWLRLMFKPELGKDDVSHLRIKGLSPKWTSLCYRQIPT